MSTYFVLSKKVSARDLFDGRLKKFGIEEHVTPETCEAERCLTDGNNYLWVFITNDGFVARILQGCGTDGASKLGSEIAKRFNTEFYSEHEPQYWGFNTEEEWRARRMG